VTLMIKDEFISSAKEVRNRVISEGFREEVGPDGFKYSGINMGDDGDLKEKIGELGQMREVAPKVSFFRQDLRGEMPHSYVHSDEICADWAGLLYLNTDEQAKGGTALWTHKHMRWDRVLSDEEIDDLGITKEAYGEQLTADWKKEELWEMSGFVSMKFNRFVVYPTRLFHSRYPHQGFGSGREDGRLVWVCFFNGKANDSA